MLDIETIFQAKKEVQGDMSYAIVRNEKLTRAEVNGKGTHNDRKAKNHTNKDIDTTKTHLNYYIKKNELTYTKEFDKYLKEICENVSIPVLRKDFTVCDYQIYEAKVLGAKAVLLICAILDTQTISEYIKICDTLGISALVEAHNEEEIKSAIASGARIIGVNNRNLKDFSVDVNNSTRYRAIIPKDIIFVSESGIKTHEDIEVLQNNKTNAVLIGETFMKSSNKKEMLRELLYGKA